MSATPEAAEETLTRFRLDALRERVKRIWAAMQDDDERDPRDYPAWDDERKILINIIRRQTERAGGGNYTEGGGDKGTKSVVIGVGITLLAAFVIGGWTLSGRVAALEAKVTEWQTATDRRLEMLERRP
jgi:hypothetical protein